MQDSWTLEDAPRQDGRTAVVTGANAGLGYEIALGLARLGARVVLACRSLSRGEAAAERIRAAVPGAEVDVRPLDLASLTSVRALAEQLTQELDSLDLLVANAGVMAVDRGRTEDGFEVQFGVNHLGHFALAAHLVPLLRNTPGARVASMSSMGHRAGRIDLDDLMGERRYRRWGAYFQSKLANLLFTAELDRRLTAAGIDVRAVAAHPGGSATDLGSEGTGLSNRLATRFVPLVLQSASAGALPMLRACTEPGVPGGAYFGPHLLGVGRPVRETPSRRARDAAMARRLWDVSEELTGVRWDLPARDRSAVA